MEILKIDEKENKEKLNNVKYRKNKENLNHKIKISGDGIVNKIYESSW